MQNEEIKTTDDNGPQILELPEFGPQREAITPTNPPWNGWTAFGVWSLSVLFIVIFPVIFVVPYAVAQNIDFSDNTAFAEFLMADRTAILLQLISVIPAHISTLVIAWMVATRWKKYSFWQTLGSDWNGFKIWHAFAITIFFFGLAAVLRLFLAPQENEFDKILSSSAAAVYLVAFIATFTAPLVEEVVYRGILYSALQRRFGVISAVAFVSILFVAVHIPQYSNRDVPDYSAIILLLMLSLVLTLIRVKTKSLLPCIILHTVFNGIQAVLLIAQPFLQTLFDQYGQKPQPPTALILILFN